METMYTFCKGVVFVSYMFGVEGLFRDMIWLLMSPLP